MKQILLIISLLVFTSSLFSQRKDVEWLRKGNEQFLSEDFDEAEISYQKSLEANSNYAYAMFNLGNTFFAKQDYEKARDQFENAARTTENKFEKSRAFYNLGASYTMTAVEIAQELQNNPMKSEDGLDPFTFLEQGAEAFKDALRNNPSDEDARYNLAYLQKLMEQSPPQQQEQEGENNEENKDQNQEDQDQKDKKDGDKGDNKDEQEGDGQDKDEPKDDADQNKPKPEELTKQQAQQILDAIDRNEKEIRDKMNLKKGKGEKIRIEKDW